MTKWWKFQKEITYHQVMLSRSDMAGSCLDEVDITIKFQPTWTIVTKIVDKSRQKVQTSMTSNTLFEITSSRKYQYWHAIIIIWMQTGRKGKILINFSTTYRNSPGHWSHFITSQSSSGIVSCIQTNYIGGLLSFTIFVCFKKVFFLFFAVFCILKSPIVFCCCIS